jgi:hypothetical protein
MAFLSVKYGSFNKGQNNTALDVDHCAVQCKQCSCSAMQCSAVQLQCNALQGRAVQAGGNAGQGPECSAALSRWPTAGGDTRSPDTRPPGGR